MKVSIFSCMPRPASTTRETTSSITTRWRFLGRSSTMTLDRIELRLRAKQTIRSLAVLFLLSASGCANDYVRPQLQKDQFTPTVMKAMTSEGIALVVSSNIYISPYDGPKVVLVEENRLAGQRLITSIPAAFSAKGISFFRKEFVAIGPNEPQCRPSPSLSTYVTASTQPAETRCPLSVKDDRTRNSWGRTLYSAANNSLSIGSLQGEGLQKVRKSVAARYVFVVTFYGGVKKSDAVTFGDVVCAINILCVAEKLDERRGDLVDTIRGFDFALYDLSCSSPCLVRSGDVYTRVSYIAADPRAHSKEEVEGYLINELFKR